jgi:hypothetical protein
MTIFLLIGLIFPRLVSLLVWIFSSTDVIANDLLGFFGWLFLPYTFLGHVSGTVLTLEPNVVMVLTFLGLFFDLGLYRLLKR